VGGGEQKEVLGPLGTEVVGLPNKHPKSVNKIITIRWAIQVDVKKPAIGEQKGGNRPRLKKAWI